MPTAIGASPVEARRCPLRSGLLRLRPGGAHCDRDFAGSGLAVLLDLEKNHRGIMLSQLVYHVSSQHMTTKRKKKRHSAFYISGIYCGILSGMCFGILSGICSSVLSGKSSGVLSRMPAGVLSAKSSGALSGISSGLLPGRCSSIISGICSSILTNVLAFYVTQILAFY